MQAEHPWAPALKRLPAQPVLRQGPHLAPERHATIAVCIPHLSGHYFSSLLRGIQAAACQRGVQVLAVQGIPLFSVESRLAMERVNGWIVVDDPRGIRELVEEGWPVITINVPDPGNGCPGVHGDPQMHRTALLHLLEHGHREIAFVGLPDSSGRRMFEITMAEHALSSDPLTVLTDDNSEASGRVAAQRLIELGMPCSAVLTNTDRNAIGLIAALQEAGYRIPEDVAVIGRDDIDGAQYTTPPLTTLRESFEQQGYTAVQLLMEQIEHGKLPPDLTYVPAMLVRRRSCGCGMEQDLQEVSPPVGSYIGADWREALARDLVQLVAVNGTDSRAAFPGATWPSVGMLLDALERAACGEPLPETSAFEQAWNEVLALTPNLETLNQILTLLESAAAQRAASRADREQTALRMTSLLQRLRLEMLRAHRAHEAARNRYLEQMLSTNYGTSMTLLEEHAEQMLNLAWMKETPISWGCLALWRGNELVIVGSYSRSGDTAVPLQSRYLPGDFPPMAILPDSVKHGGPEIVKLLRIRTNRNDWGWGFLVVCGPVETYAVRSDNLEHISMWAGMLGAALEREDLISSLSKARRAAEEANQLKSKFLANMSHELRTPLNAILNFTRFMGKERYGPLTDRQRELQQRVLANAEHLLGLINDILDLSKIEAGRMDLYYEQVDMLPLLQGVMSTAVGLTKDKGLSLTLEVAEELAPVWVDRTRIRQVLLNLLSNAAKFTERGSITVRAFLDDQQLLCITVEDTGIGIPLDYQGLVFEEFRQVQGELTREYQGTGLGLPISKRLVEMHGGTMWMESQPGKGSTFCFTLPTLHEPAPLSTRPEGAGPALAVGDERPLVVVVDDDPQIHSELQSHLEHGGYRVASVLDSRQALATIRRLHPALVLLDLLMPDMDGWEVLAQLHATPETNAIPVIICSKVSQERVGLVLGSRACVTKPIQRESLLEQVAQCTRGSGRVMVVDDDPDARLMMHSVLQEAGYEVFEAGDGIEALTTIGAIEPDLMILDLMMPQMDGFELLRRLRREPSWIALPVIVVSAMDLSLEERRMLLDRSQLCLQKSSFSMDEFVSYVHKFLAYPVQKHVLAED